MCKDAQNVGYTSNTAIVNNKKIIQNMIRDLNPEDTVDSAAAAFFLAIDHVDDPRDIERSNYLIGEILFTAVLAMMCGATSYQDFASFATSQIDWLRKWIPMEHGAASHDTYRRVFQFLPPESLTECLSDMFHLLDVDAKGDHVALDGKKFRGCFNKKGLSLLNSVGAYSIENGICLTQKPTKNEDGKEVGEMKTIPEVIRSIDITDTLVTIDAGGCYSEIAEAVIDGGGDYAIGLKANQPTIYHAAEQAFAEHEKNNFKDVPMYQEVSKGHGRTETRTYYAIPLPPALAALIKWVSIVTIILCISVRTVKGVTTVSRRYYISSLGWENIAWLGRSIRCHWGIENSLHWVLDVTYNEDSNRTRKDNGAENLGIIRRIALNLMNRGKGKFTHPTARYRAALDPNYREQLIVDCLK